MHFIVSLAFCMGWDFLPMIKPCKFFAVDDTNKIFLMVMSIVFLAVAVYNKIKTLYIYGFVLCIFNDRCNIKLKSWCSMGIY